MLVIKLKLVSVPRKNKMSISSKTKKNKNTELLNFFKKASHFFIMTEGGMPIYSRYGDEIENCGILATFSAIMTKLTIFNSTSSYQEKVR